MKGRLKLSSVLTLCLAFTLAIAVPYLASAEVIEEWVARYNSLGVGNDSANAITVGPSGNVYVTGTSEGSGTGLDYATVKYDTEGNQLWVKRYDGPGNGSDEARSIAVDPSGNVYVTGESSGSGTGDDYATVKYDTDGNQLWVQRYNGPGDSYDEANAIAVDSSGNVYVTGTSATVKYDPDGNQLWVAQHSANAIAVDSSGNVYVTSSGYATVKYDTNGNELWVARYNGPINDPDEATAIAVDASGNVYVTGWSAGSGTGLDYATVKYDTDGNQLWVARYNGPGNYDDYAKAMAVDASGNVCVTGGSWGSETGNDYATVKYDTHGNQLWLKRYNGPGNDSDYARSIAIDASGNVYVTGQSWGSGTNNDCATVKYDTNGNQLWLKRYNGPGSGGDLARSIAIDASGNVYVTGWSWGSGTCEDYATLKYDPDGNELWMQRYNGPGSGHDYATAIAVDASGNVYVTGTSEFDYATVKYDPGGNELWMQRYNGRVGGWDCATEIAVDTSGNVYVTGWSWGKGMWAQWDDYATVKYDSAGNELWVARYTGPGGDDSANAIAVDASGNVYVTGTSKGSGTDDDYATVKYDTNGNQLWIQRYNGPGNDEDRASAIAIDASGNVYVTGWSDGSVTGRDYATVKYDTHGNQLWVKRYDGPGNGSDEARSIAVDAAGNVYVTGWSWGGNETQGDYATVKYDIDGNQLWMKRYDGPGNGYDYASAIAVDASGNVYVTGYSFGSGTDDDYATVKYDIDGNQLWVKRYDGPGNGSDEARSIAVDPSGNVYVTGESSGSGTGIEDVDYATVKYDADGNQLWVQRYNGPR